PQSPCTLRYGPEPQASVKCWAVRPFLPGYKARLFLWVCFHASTLRPASFPQFFPCGFGNYGIYEYFEKQSLRHADFLSICHKLTLRFLIYLNTTYLILSDQIFQPN